jgi:hypothetical protein
MLVQHVLRRPRTWYPCFQSSGQLKSSPWVPRLPVRPYSVASSDVDAKETTQPTAEAEAEVYHGPFASTLKRLKIFSLSSLALSTSLTPFMFVVESSLPLSARLALATTAITTSGISTALVAWCGSPYVATLRRLNGDVDGLEFTTFSLTLRRIVTRVYDTTFLVDTKRPFAKWELAEVVNTAAKPGLPGQEETVAETLDAEGAVTGRWVVTWSDDNRGTCRKIGSIARYVDGSFSFVFDSLNTRQIFQCSRRIVEIVDRRSVGAADWRW